MENFIIKAFSMADIKDDFVLNFIKDNRWKYLTDGLKITLEVTFFAVILGIVLGSVIAIIRSTYDTNYESMKSKVGKAVLKILNLVAKIYLTVIRGTPVVVQLMIMYYVIFSTSNNKVPIAILSFGINSGAYVAEIIRSGIMAIDRGQFEAGRSLGFNYIQTMIYIILPQAFKNILPALGNEFIVLIKETSISGYIGMMDLTKGGDIVRSITYEAYMPLFAVAIVYLVTVMILSAGVNKLERKLRNSER